MSTNLSVSMSTTPVMTLDQLFSTLPSALCKLLFAFCFKDQDIPRTTRPGPQVAVNDTKRRGVTDYTFAALISCIFPTIELTLYWANVMNANLFWIFEFSKTPYYYFQFFEKDILKEFFSQPPPTPSLKETVSKQIEFIFMLEFWSDLSSHFLIFKKWK